MYKLYTDGSHAHDIDIAGIGGVLYDENNIKIWEFSELLNVNKAQHELMALKYGISKCLDKGIKSIACYTDCLGIVKLFKDKKITDEQLFTNKELKLDIFKLIEKFENISFSYIPRDNNKEADKLARKNLIKILKEKTRSSIIKENQPEHNFFDCEQIKCHEKHTANEKEFYLETKKKISTHYLFHTYSIDQQTYIDIYKAKKEESITSEKIKTYHLPKNNTENFLKIITKTIEESIEQDIILLIKKDSDVDLLLRGMKSINKKMIEPFEKLKTLIQTKNSIFIENNGDVNESIFPTHIKPFVMNEKEFYLKAIKKLGENYQIGDSPEIDNYFKLSTYKANNVTEIQKKYFGAFIKMMNAQSANLNFKDVKESLIKEGFKFTY